MRNSEEKRLQRVVATVCATLFAVFSFLFVAVYQAPLLEALYNEIATGKLRFNPYLVGAAVSLALTAFALWLNRFAKFRREWTAFAYLPSALLLAFITDVDRSLYVGGRSYVGWCVIFILGFLLYATLSYLLRKMLFGKIKDVAMTTNRVVWRNLMLMLLLVCLVGTLSNSEENFKRETRMMSHYNNGELGKALNVGKKSDDASHELTVMRAYILASNGLLGEHLFEYPQHYATDGLLPKAERTSPLVPDSVYSLLGATPLDGEDAGEFLFRIAHTDSASTVAKEYYLSSLLLERRIIKFKDEIMDFYGAEAVDSLPKHFREALLLYADVAAADEVVAYDVDDAALRSRLDAMRALEAKHADVFIRGNYVRHHFGDTYWSYFLYPN
jgi:hypothetical protein